MKAKCATSTCTIPVEFLFGSKVASLTCKRRSPISRWLCERPTCANQNEHCIDQQLPNESKSSTEPSKYAVGTNEAIMKPYGSITLRGTNMRRGKWNPASHLPLFSPKTFHPYTFHPQTFHPQTLHPPSFTHYISHPYTFHPRLFNHMLFTHGLSPKFFSSTDLSPAHFSPTDFLATDFSQARVSLWAQIRAHFGHNFLRFTLGKKNWLILGIKWFTLGINRFTLGKNGFILFGHK